MLKFLLFYLILFIIRSAAFGNDIELSADNGLEWNQEKMTISAIQNASIKRDKLTLISDKIVVHYRNKSVAKNINSNKAEIFLIYANGNVVLNSPKEQISADYIEYNLDNNTISIKPINRPIKMKAYDADIFANGKIMYYEDKNYAIVNNATIFHSGRSLSSDIMKLEFDKLDAVNNKSSIGLGLSKVTATGNLTIKDKAEILTGNVAIYDNKTGMVSIDGNVELSRGGGSKLQGGKIEYNMKTGITRLLPDPVFGKVVGIFKSVNKKR